MPSRHTISVVADSSDVAVTLTVFAPSAEELHPLAEGAIVAVRDARVGSYMGEVQLVARVQRCAAEPVTFCRNTS